MVHARQCHFGDCGGCGSRLGNYKNPAVVWRCCQPSITRAVDSRIEARQVGDLHAGQQSPLHSQLHCLSLPRNEFQGLRGQSDSGRCACQPTRRYLRNGPGGQGAGGAIRYGGDLSQGQCRLRSGRSAFRRGRFRRHQGTAVNPGRLCAKGCPGGSGCGGHSQRGRLRGV